MPDPLFYRTPRGPSSPSHARNLGIYEAAEAALTFHAEEKSPYSDSRSEPANGNGGYGYIWAAERKKTGKTNEKEKKKIGNDPPRHPTRNCGSKGRLTVVWVN